MYGPYIFIFPSGVHGHSGSDTYINIYIHTYIHKYTRIYMYTCMHSVYIHTQALMKGHKEVGVANAASRLVENSTFSMSIANKWSKNSHCCWFAPPEIKNKMARNRLGVKTLWAPPVDLRWFNSWSDLIHFQFNPLQSNLDLCSALIILHNVSIVDRFESQRSVGEERVAWSEWGEKLDSRVITSVNGLRSFFGSGKWSEDRR